MWCWYCSGMFLLMPAGKAAETHTATRGTCRHHKGSLTELAHAHVLLRPAEVAAAAHSLMETTRTRRSRASPHVFAVPAAKTCGKPILVFQSIKCRGEGPRLPAMRAPQAAEGLAAPPRRSSLPTPVNLAPSPPPAPDQAGRDATGRCERGTSTTALTPSTPGHLRRIQCFTFCMATDLDHTASQTSSSP